jgi:DNA-binding transcriptional LysR family regulator
VNIQQLRTFVTVVDAGSFSAASRVLKISQPAVTMQIQSLESELGSTLLERRYRRVELTEAGKILMPVAQRVLSDLQVMREEIAGLSGEVTGHLVIAASTTPGVYVIPRFVGGFLAAHPRVELTLLVADSAEVVRRVAEAEAGIGITGAEVKGGRVDYEQLAVDELIAIGPPDSPLGGARHSMQELAGSRLVTREIGSGTRQAAEALLTEHGVDVEGLDVALELGTGEAVVTAVEGGLGAAIVSRLVAQRALALGAVVELDIEGFPAERPLYAVTPKGGPSQASRAFLEYLRDNIARG